MPIDLAFVDLDALKPAVVLSSRNSVPEKSNRTAWTLGTSPWCQV